MHVGFVVFRDTGIHNCESSVLVFDGLSAVGKNSFHFWLSIPSEKDAMSLCVFGDNVKNLGCRPPPEIKLNGFEKVRQRVVLIAAQRRCEDDRKLIVTLTICLFRKSGKR